jgi:putative spermidine/putrescine transport system substrate-binding protein
MAAKEKSAMNSRRLIVLLAVSLLVSLSVFASGAKEEPKAQTKGSAETKAVEMPFKGQTLIVSSWGFNQDKLDKNINKPFEEKYGVKIVFEVGNNADRLTKLVARKNNPNVDLVQFAGDYVYLAMKEGVLQPFDPAKLANLKDLYDWAKDPMGGNYAVGYAVSSLALAYRSDKIAAPMTSWADLLRPELKGFVTLPDITTTFGPSMIVLLAKSFGGSFENVEPAWTKLNELKASIPTVYRRSPELITLIKQGEVWTAPYASFSWSNLVETGVPLKSVIPKEGLAGSQSMVSLVKGAKNVELAHRFIDWISSQEAQKANALELVDSPTNKTVQVPADVAAKLTYGPEVVNALLFVDDAKLAPLKADWIKRWNQLFAK